MKAKAYSQRISFGAAALCALLLVILSAQRALTQTNTFPSSGNAGVGTTTPVSPLEIQAPDGPLTLSQSGVAGKSTIQAAIGTDLHMSANAKYSSSTWNRYDTSKPSWNFFLAPSSGADYAGLRRAAAGSGAITWTDLIRITNTGNVGIGTTSPAVPLHVQTSSGPAKIKLQTTDATSFEQMILGNGNGGANASGVLEVINESSTLSGRKGDIELFNQSQVAGAHNAITFWTNNGARGAADVTIDSTGNVGIGTTTLDHRLQISGGAQDGIVLNASTYPEIRLDKSSTIEGYLAVAGNAGGYAPNTTTNSLLLMGTNNLHLISNSTIGLTVNTSGNVGIGTTSPQYKLDVAGNINSSATITGNNIVAKYQDVAEYVPSSEKLAPGTVVVLDATKSNQVIASTKSYDTRVAGVVSEQPGIALGESGANKVLVATTGRVQVKVDASRSPIQIGDLLVTSDIRGVAMKSEPINIGGRLIHMPGTLIGKALEPLASGSGEILVLLSLQ